MILAELTVRHTRRHMPTRRVAVGEPYLPTTRSGRTVAVAARRRHGRVSSPQLDDEQIERAAAACSHDVRRSGSPCRASRCGTGSRPTSTGSTAPATGSSKRRAGSSLELDRARRCRPAGDRRDDGRRCRCGSVVRGSVAFRALKAALRHPGVIPEGVRGPPAAHGGTERVAPAACRRRAGRGRLFRDWRRRLLGRGAGRAAVGDGGASASAPGPAVERSDVLARFRRLLRLAHPDHGGRVRRRGRADRGAPRGGRPCLRFQTPRSPGVRRHCATARTQTPGGTAAVYLGPPRGTRGS